MAQATLSFVDARLFPTKVTKENSSLVQRRVWDHCLPESPPGVVLLFQLRATVAVVGVSWGWLHWSSAVQFLFPTRISPLLSVFSLLLYCDGRGWGSGPGELRKPCGLRLSRDGQHVVVADYHNDRVCVYRVEDGAFVGTLATRVR